MFHFYWPPLLFLAMFVLGVIMALLRYGPRFLNIRHTTRPDEADWQDKTYEQSLSYA
jgi:uncharacterized integral membrane protein